MAALPTGIPIAHEPLVASVLAPNASAYTYTGTQTYLVGTTDLAVIDPGPDDSRHLAALLAAIDGRPVRAIVVTHHHRDHSPASRPLAVATGAAVIGAAPFHHRGQGGRADEAYDADYAPARVLAEGDTVAGQGWTLTTVATPGHTSNHLAFALREEAALFSGDHVMAWSTTVVAPPDGAMRAYMASLEALRDRDETIYWPGHGGPVRDPRRFVRGLATHRRQRETAIRSRVEAGDRDIGTIVAAIYQGLKPALHGAAALSVFAHLEDLVERGIVRSDGPARLDGRYGPA